MTEIYNEDCLITMSKMRDNYIDLVVTSPPYDNLRKYSGYSFDFDNIAKELYRIVKNGGIIVWVIGDQTIDGSESGTSFKQALFFKEIGFNIHDTMIYAKENAPPMTHNRYEQSFEYMFIFSKGKPKTFNPIKIDCIHAGQIKNRKNTLTSRDYTNEIIRVRDEETQVKQTKIKNNIWYYTVGGNNGVANKHPAIFPEQLAYDHIVSWSNENDFVYDPFSGSGTVAKCCKILNRNFIGSEISSEYCQIIEERLNNV